MGVGLGLLVVLAIAVGAGCASRSTVPVSTDGVWQQRPIYPFAPTNAITDTYHGVQVAEPYRWLEDDQDPAVQAWVAAENRLTAELLGRLPARSWIAERLVQLGRFEHHGLPVGRGGRTFFTLGVGGQSDGLYWAESLEAEPRLIVGPEDLRGLGVGELAGWSVSPDGNRVAFGVADLQSGGRTWRVRDVGGDHQWPDVVGGVQFSDVVWTADSGAFFYCRFGEAKTNAAPAAEGQGPQLFRHRLGEDASEDDLIYSRPDQLTWSFHPRASEDGRYLILHVVSGTDPGNRFFYLDLGRPGAGMVELIPGAESRFVFLGNVGERFYFQTDSGAPRGRVIAVDGGRPAPADWEEVVPETGDTLESTGWAGGRLYLRYLHDAVSRVVSVERDGSQAEEVSLPGLGSVTGFGGMEGAEETFYLFSSFAVPPTLYRYDLRDRVSTVARSPRVDFDPGDYVTRQVFYRSADGTRVPMFLAHRRDLAMDGDCPTLLYGYGGFGVSLKPGFSPAQLLWMEMGGVYAVPNLRGGGEYGEDWHQAGTRGNRARVAEDFIAAAEWLILNRVTSSRRLAALGTSNGGLLVATCLTQRPGLFTAAVISSGVLDLLRFPRFTIGWAWIPEYGDPNDPVEFETLYAASPLHNVRAGTVYPSMLVTTASHDDRIVPGHSYKFIAALQAAHAGNNPVILRAEPPPAADGSGPDPRQRTVDAWAFLANELRMRIPPVEE